VPPSYRIFAFLASSPRCATVARTLFWGVNIKNAGILCSWHTELELGAGQYS
jgi:hypothetical protein